MAKATLNQILKLVGPIEYAPDPRRYAQRLITSMHVLHMLGKGEIDQATIMALIKAGSNPFASQRSKTPCHYPRSWVALEWEQQLEALKRFYPELDGTHVPREASELVGPESADGVFVVPKLSVVAADIGIEHPFGEDYHRLLEVTVLAYIAKSRPFNSHPVRNLAPRQLMLRQQAIDALSTLEGTTPGDFLVFAAQTGKKYAGYSASNARWEIEHGSTNEFPLSIWCVGHILLTDPRRLTRHGDLGIGCPGDEYIPSFDKEFERALSFHFTEGELQLLATWPEDTIDHLGPASGFLQ